MSYSKAQIAWGRKIRNKHEPWGSLKPGICCVMTGQSVIIYQFSLTIYKMIWFIDGILDHHCGCCTLIFFCVGGGGPGDWSLYLDFWNGCEMFLCNLLNELLNAGHVSYFMVDTYRRAASGCSWYRPLHLPRIYTPHLRIKPRTLCLLDKHSTMELHL